MDGDWAVSYVGILVGRQKLTLVLHEILIRDA